MLKIKKLVNYRQAKISVDGRDRNCGHCARRNLIDIYGIPPFPGGGKLLGPDYRCTEIGLNASRRYFVAANHVCDRFKCNCCERGDEYNGFGSDGPTIFTCPKRCSCHD